MGECDSGTGLHKEDTSDTDCPITDVYTLLPVDNLWIEVIGVRWFAGMERRRSRFGEWLEREGLSQLEVSRMSGVSQQTINGLATGDVKRPTRLTARKLMSALKEVDPEVTLGDFWDV